MWITSDELDLLDKVFEKKDLVPKNRKHNLKLRHISFFSTNIKSITHLCKSLNSFSYHENLAHQYTEVLKSLALLDNDDNISKYGNMLLSIIHNNDNNFYNAINKATSVEQLDEEIPIIIEFFLFLVLNKCVNNPDSCKANNIDFDSLNKESFYNLDYFFKNIVDTINEPSNKNSDYLELFNYDNDDFYYVLQGINFSGYEIKKLFRLKLTEIKKFIDLYSRLLSEVSAVNSSTLNAREKNYYDYAEYYVRLVQKDVRNRVKRSVFNYILFNSIVDRRKHISIKKIESLSKIISFDYIEKIYSEYHLDQIYKMVIYERDSIYLDKKIILFSSDTDVISDSEKYRIEVNEDEFSKTGITNNSTIALFVNGDLSHNHLFKIIDISREGMKINLLMIAQEKIKDKDFLKKKREEIYERNRHNTEL